MDSLNLVTAIRGLVLDGLYEMHTSLPARVVSVDYGAKTVHLESLVNNTRGSEDSTAYPTMYDVPIMTLAGGDARISMPVRVGDVGVVMFSERDPSNALQADGTSATDGNMAMPCGIYPVAFLPKTALGGDSTPALDENNIVIGNNQTTSMSFSPDGEMIIESTLGGKITVNDSVTITDGVGTLTLSDGNLTFTGGVVNLNGYVISSGGVATDSSGVVSNSHTHPVKGVQTGSGQVISNPPQ